MKTKYIRVNSEKSEPIYKIESSSEHFVVLANIRESRLCGVNLYSFIKIGDSINTSSVALKMCNPIDMDFH